MASRRVGFRQVGANKRESHVSMGGVQLSHFAEGLSLEDLDRAVSHQE